MLRSIAAIPLPNLIIAGGTIGIATGVMGLLAHREREKMLEKTPFLKKVLQLVKRDEIYDILGGNDLTFGRPDLSDRWSKANDTQIKLIVPVKGDKEKGQIFITAVRPDQNHKYSVTKVEMKFKKIQNKKLVLLDVDNDIGLPIVNEPDQVDKDEINSKKDVNEIQSNGQEAIENKTEAT